MYQELVALLPSLSKSLISAFCITELLALSTVSLAPVVTPWFDWSRSGNGAARHAKS